MKFINRQWRRRFKMNKEYTTIDKSKWKRGAWDNESDKMQFIDEETGYTCLIVRVNHHGALCGYVGVHEGHPTFEKDYDSVNAKVHGGLTFSGHCQKGKAEAMGVCHVPEKGETDNIWWLGFDCAHAYDVCPGYNWNVDESSVYRDVGYVKNEIKQLARQLKEMKNG